jgi:hypothetical protein
VTPVRAGARFKEEVALPLPLLEYRQYNGEMRAHPEQSPLEIYQEVYFSMGYYWRAEGTKEIEKEVNDTPVIMPQAPPGTPIEFGILDSERKRMDIPVELRGGKRDEAGVAIRPAV